MVFVSSLTVVQWLAKKIGIEPPVVYGAADILCFGAAVCSLVGYYAVRKTKSVLALLGTGLLTFLSAFTYWWSLNNFVGVTLWKVAFLYLMYGLTFGSFYALMRVLYNLSLR